MEQGAAIRVWEHPGARRVRRWRSGHISAADCVHVSVGRLPSGWWFAERGAEARVYRSEADALGVAERLRQGRDGWREVPAEMGPDGRPASPGWVRRGGDWLREG